MWRSSSTTAKFENFNEQWWATQKNHHHFSKTSGALCKLHSECCYPMSSDVVAKKVVAIDYDAERTWSEDPIIKMADVFFENRKGAKNMKASKANWNTTPTYCNKTDDEANLWYYKSSDGGQVILRLLDFLDFCLHYQKCLMMHCAMMAEKITTNIGGVQSGSFNLFLFDLLRYLKRGVIATITKQKPDEPRKIATTSCQKLYVKIKEVIFSCFRSSSYDFIDFLSGSQEVLMLFWQIELEMNEEENKTNTAPKVASTNNIKFLDVAALRHNWFTLMQTFGAKFFALLDLQIKITQHQLLLTQDRVSGKITFRDIELL